MSEEGGFLVKFDGKEITRCHSIAFDHDDWQYTVNNTENHELPAGVRNISITIEAASY